VSHFWLLTLGDDTLLRLFLKLMKFLLCKFDNRGVFLHSSSFQTYLETPLGKERYTSFSDLDAFKRVTTAYLSISLRPFFSRFSVDSGVALLFFCRPLAFPIPPNQSSVELPRCGPEIHLRTLAYFIGRFFFEVPGTEFFSQ